jgi:RHS repeat-associated protein
VVAGFDSSNTTLTGLDDSAAYDPFGQATAQSGTDHDLGYQGSWTDPDTDEVNMGARWYDSATGTFDSQDPQTYSSGPSILANGYTYAAGDPMDLSDPDGNWPSCGWCSKAASAVSSAVTSAARTVGSAVSSAASYAWHAVTYVASKAVSAVKTAAKYVAKAAAKVYNAGKAAISYVANKVSESASYLRQKAAAAAAYAKQRAEAARRAAIAHAKAVTRKAKAAAVEVIKHNPLPAVKALLKPVVGGLKKAIAASAKLPAAVVAVSRTVVVDVAKSTTAIYQKAINSAGVVIDDVGTAVTAAGEFAQAAIPTVAGIAAGVATATACTVATSGAAAPACLIAGFAVGSAVTSALTCAPGRSIAGCAATGAAVGAVAGAVTVATGGAGAGAGLATVVGSGAASGAASSATEQLLDTGSIDVGKVASAAAVGGATAGAAHGAGKLLGSSASCSTNSFVAGTQVLMADGSSKPIEDVAIGDEVKATDPTTGKTASEPVTALIVGQGEKNLTTVQTSDGSRAALGNKDITATAGHPFWVSGDTSKLAEKAASDDLGQWVVADHLKAGDHLVSAAPRDGPVTVSSTHNFNQFATVYNLTVNSLHTYYVLIGRIPVLVHNQEPGCINWDSKSVKTWGHSFKTHGAGVKNTRSLTDRARSTGNEQGQWLDNDAAADFLREVHTPGAGPFSVRLPEGLGQVIKPDGTVAQAPYALIVPSPNGLFKSAYPYSGMQ